MNIYDFDNTILKGDSSWKFIKYSFVKHPFLVSGCLFKTLWESIKYLFKKSSFESIKSVLFSFVKDIDNLDLYINKFVLKNLKYIKKFYLARKKDNDVIISASFEFIVKPFCDYLKVSYIATKYDIKNGKIIGKNCKGQEKINRFRKMHPNVKVKEAYSDSLSDIPMFEIAEVGYLVKNEKLTKYKY